MELRLPRIKNQCKSKQHSPLEELSTKISASFNGFSIIIDNPEDMEHIYKKGFFGKANLSRSYPTFDKNNILRRRQYFKRSKFEDKRLKGNKLKKVIVVPDSDTDNENYFTNLKPEYQIDRSEMKENLCLSLSEAYYLSHVVGCLQIFEEGITLSGEDMWSKFCSSDAYFISNYITYHHFRKKGWIVKPGIKFGGDYILYKGGPPYYHASYVIIIDVLNEDLARRKDMQRRSMEIINIIGLNRLCETAGKELLLCQLIWPQNLSANTDEDLSKVTINEILVRRWTESQEK